MRRPPARRCSGWTLTGARCRNRTCSPDNLCGRCAGGTGVYPPGGAPAVFGSVAAPGPWDDIDERVRLRAARRASTPPEALARLAEHDTSRDVAAVAAANRNCPADVLVRLASSPHDAIVFAVASNPAAPPEALTGAWQSKAATYWDDLRGVIAYNHGCPADVLAAAAEDSSVFVRAAAAGNPNTSPEVLAGLAGDPSASVREALLFNPNAPAAARAHVGLLNDN